jgi:hypothetical protein
MPNILYVTYPKRTAAYTKQGKPLMAKRGRRSSKGYRKMIISAIQDGLLQPLAGSVIQVDVIHKDSCSFLRGGECDCDPDLLQRSETKEKIYYSGQNRREDDDG